ncbi:hypothetical protein ES754_02265 [Psychrobacter frigidicola]|uniref:Asparagine synthetase domain-containing protein n=1 Tax=Psychrobacter frigidicola TaxID=45611 RepID=A0A5C7A560_9GAMM|nr:hypothetical protein [Psychrobacter frigidicola]TXD97815.1 hypothetical protein ES754_02265 [Psychrobacter frigidicola]
MANYIFIKARQEVKSSKMLQELEQVCSLLTPVAIKGKSQDTVEVWPDDSGSFYAIQNSESVAKPEQGALIIGWLHQSDSNKSGACNSEADGSYAVIKNTENGISFFSDQFGSRTLWYYFDDTKIIVSTSQRAVVTLKGSFRLNEETLAWYLSSGSQGPFISWDQDIKQVLPNLEYKLDVTDWYLDSKQKPGMDIPPSGSTKMSDYLDLYQNQVTESLDQIINEYPEGQVLMPLSGGLDSRLLLALSNNADLDDKLSLVNWGVLNQKGIFDDKVAAQRVANFYKKNLLDMSLPTEISAYDQVLDHFSEASEGRIDHFNAFTDGFKMWDEFFQRGYRMIIRGDIPFPAGLCLDEFQVRTMMGLELFSDYSNMNDFNVKEYSEPQKEYLTKRLEGESLIRWRDRTLTDIRVPIVMAAYSHQISAFAENRTPMMSWSLFKLYMGLPDKEKGDKLHIKMLWQKYDRSGVPSHAVGSLRSMDSYFNNKEGKKYLLDKLALLIEGKYLSSSLVDSVHEILSKQEFSSLEQQHTAVSKKALVSQKIQTLLSNHLPALPKAYLKSKRSKKLSVITIAYRIVLAEKIITMYGTDARQIKESE